MISYLLQTSGSIALFYVLYFTLFRKLTFFRINRLMLLSIPLVSVLLPFIRLRQIDQITAAYILPAIEVDNQYILMNTMQSSNFSLGLILVVLYITGLIITTLLLLVRFLQLYRFLRKQEYAEEGNYKVALSAEKYSSFSFFNYIIVNREEEDHKSLIIQHEQWHFKMGHSVDNSFMECLKCLLWFNPFVYLLHRELRSVHEYEVDEVLSQSGHKLSYLDEMTDEVMLLKELKLTSTFKSNSNLLKRIKMMYNRRSPKKLSWYYLSIFPVTLLAFFITSCSESSENLLKPEEKEPVENEIIYTGKESDELTSMPEFPGGIEALYAFLGKEIKYPEEAKKEELAGKVFVSFVIDNTGKVTGVKVVRGLHPALDAEALRAISSMPDWIPAVKDAENVAVVYMLPVQFALR